MRSYLSLLALVLGSIFMTGCEDKPTPEPTPEPVDPVKPEITVTEGEITENTFTFEISTSTPGEYAYYYNSANDTSLRPSIPDWFEKNSGAIEQTATVTIDNLIAGIEYELYVVVRSTAGSLLSDVKSVVFTTMSSNAAGPVSLTNVAHDRYSFRVDINGSYLYYGISESTLSAMNASPEQWVETFGYYAEGADEYEFINGEYHDPNDVNRTIVIPGSKHYAIVAECDSSKNVYQDRVYVVAFDTPAVPEAKDGVTITLSNVTSTSVVVNCVPASSIAEYHILINPKANVDSIINNPAYGESTLVSIMKTGYSSWHLSGNYEATWGGLLPSTEYYVCVCVVDKEGGEKFTNDIVFTTAEGSGVQAELDVELVPASDKPYEKIDIKVKANNAVAIKYAFTDSAAIDAERKQSDDSAIVNLRGADFDAEQLSQALAGGVTITREDLWPEAEYTVIVRAITEERVETIKSVTVSLPAMPVATRVESDLFESLQGEWLLSYSYRDIYGNIQKIENKVVNIAQGVDAKTETDYRNQNRLVITGWQFQKDDIPFFTPADLMESYWGWRDQYAPLAYRDYGPKVFLEIADGDVITMPTAKNMYLYHWDEYDNLLQFYGCDYDKLQTAPSPFPVEHSADGNTLTIKPYVSGEEFNYGTYYPAVFRGNEAWSVATTNITLTRK